MGYPFHPQTIEFEPKTIKKMITWWKSKTRWALSDISNRSRQPTKPLLSFFSNSSNKSGKCTTTPLPRKINKYIKS